MQQSTDQQVTMVNVAQSQAQLSAMLNGQTERVDIAVDTHEEAHRELARRTNLDKRVVLNTLFGFNQFNQVDTKQKVTLPAIFGRYFKGLVNDVYTFGDLEKLSQLLAKEKDDAPFKIDVSRLKPRVKKGFYGDKKSYMLYDIVDGATRQLLIGASRTDCAVYFLFTNEKSDVSNGVIYVRDSSTSTLKRVNTFEVNPFVRGRGVVTDPETGATDVKDQLTFNPGWLALTVNNMERYVFAPLVYVPPKPQLPKKRKGVTEVDMKDLIEKTLADSKIDPALAGEKVAEEVRTGIDAYRDKALAEIAKNQQEVPEVVNPKTIANTRAENQRAQCDIGKGVVLCPEMVAELDKPMKNTSYMETVLRMDEPQASGSD